MKREEIKKALYNRFIKPTEQMDKRYVGIEIEMPITNLSGEATDQSLTQRVFKEFVENFGFEPDKYDNNGVCYSATLAEKEDNIIFDCSYNNLEIALGREENINELDKRFHEYISFLNNQLEKEGHLLTGFGINPGYKVNSSEYIPAERYRILGQHLKSSADWNLPMYLHPYKSYGTFASASQVQLDVQKDNLIDTINAFSLLEPVKAVLFANSILTSEPDFLCSRDLLWEDGPIGINPHNVGMHEIELKDISDLTEYLATTSIFNVERNGHYIHFKPIVITDYMNSDLVEGEYYKDGKYRQIFFQPSINDIKFLRTYKNVDLTFRGTLEFRSCCNQPFCEAMTVAAFHAGLIEKVPELLELLENDQVLFHHGYNVKELRRMMTLKDWPSFVNKTELKNLILHILDLCKEGLIERGYGEEKYIEPLYKRALTLASPGRVVVDYKKDHEDLTEIIKEYAKLD